MIQVQYILSEDDLVKAGVLHFKTHRVSLITRAFGCGCIAIVGLIMASGGDLWKILPFVLFAVVMLGYHLLVVPWEMKSQFRKLQGRNTGATWTFDDDTMSAKGTDAEFTQKWSVLFESIESDDCLLLYPHANSYHILPARVFSGAEYRQVCEMARKQVARHRIHALRTN